MPKKKSPVLEEETEVSEAAPKKEVEKTKKVQEPEVEVKSPAKALATESPAEKTKRELEAGPQIAYVVPLDPGEKPGAVQVVSLNGYALTIKKGVRVTIPIAMADILDEKYQVESEAGAAMRDDNWDEKKLDRIG